MLRFNSANAVLPGGPVSSASGTKEIFGVTKNVSLLNAGSTFGRSTTDRARFLAGALETARRILQHVVAVGFGDLAGLEWNGQPPEFVGGLVPTAVSTQ